MMDEWMRVVITVLCDACCVGARQVVWTMEQFHVAAADGQTPLVMSGGHVVMQALSGQMSAGQTLQSPAGQVNVK